MPFQFSSKCIAIIILLGLMIVSFLKDAYPHGACLKGKNPQNDFPFGVSAAYVYDDSSGGAVSIDLLKSVAFISTSINLKLANTKEQLKYGAQFDCILWFLLINIGGGVDYFWGTGDNFGFHLYLGFPLWNSLELDSNFLKEYYFIPFYRLYKFNTEKFHEFGLSVRFSMQ